MTELQKALTFNAETKAALQAVFEELNHGQQQKLARNEKARPVLLRYGILTEPAAGEEA